MKTKFLMIIAVLVVLFPLIPLVQFYIDNQVMADVMTTSSSIVLLTSFVFSMFSWSLLAWASKSIKIVGIPLSIISSMVLMIPFYDVLGPMAAVVIGIVAGLVAYMIQKYLKNTDNKSLMIAMGIVVATYLVLSVMLFLISPVSHVWDTGYGGGVVDLDPNLAPSFSQDFIWYKFLTPLTLPILVISSLFIGTFAILKLKKISSKPYISLEFAGLLLFFGVSNLVSSLGFLPIIISQPEQIRSYIFEQIFVALWVPTVTLSIAGILLYRSSVIRMLIRK
ncbi:MAG: hypothetical protein ACW9W3_06390 [Candidatus Nitrosopumilus sp. bin_68KS]